MLSTDGDALITWLISQNNTYSHKSFSIAWLKVGEKIIDHHQHADCAWYKFISSNEVLMKF
jgi:hypothetical protein